MSEQEMSRPADPCGLPNSNFAPENVSGVLE